MIDEEKLAEKRRKLIRELRWYGIDPRVLEAMERVPRHLFVPEYLRDQAYADYPLPIGMDQTISAPHMVALMCSYLDLGEEMKVLEIGAGSGYHAAVMAELVGKNGHVYTIERFKALAEFAKENLLRAKVENVTVIVGDGTLGLPEYAPYDRICITASAPNIPLPLLEQLKKGGKMVLPIGRYHQDLYLVEKNDKIKKTCKGGVRFVLLIGKYGFQE
ncbi:MAG: protein-L-isoaspartate O-methyltransferase [Halobacteria archaeon]